MSFLSIWFSGFIGIVLGRAFYLGMNYSKIVKKSDYSSEMAVYEYVTFSFIGAMLWPIVAPILLFFAMGSKFNKEK
jgi:cell shape-determining protein MreD